jgi:cobalt-zinc-cadmium efflux system outer membrane protein
VTDAAGLAAKRPDVAALDAAIAQAQADAEAARSFRHPEVDVGVRYEREEEADIVSGALSISLPFFDRGQGPAAEAGARGTRLALERDALLRAAESEIAAAVEAHRLRREAALAIEAALPGIAESERLATRSYETGQISLVELLIVRAGLNEARRDHLERLLEAAIAGIELASSMGVLR